MCHSFAKDVSEENDIFGQVFTASAFRYLGSVIFAF